MSATPDNATSGRGASGRSAGNVARSGENRPRGKQGLPFPHCLSHDWFPYRCARTRPFQGHYAAASCAPLLDGTLRAASPSATYTATTSLSAPDFLFSQLHSTLFLPIAMSVKSSVRFIPSKSACAPVPTACLSGAFPTDGCSHGVRHCTLLKSISVTERGL
jgi:hypothetical protein